jgi:Leucine-rich repeat (LRR) protein
MFHRLPLLSTPIRANELSVEFFYGSCQVTVISSITKISIEDQLKTNCSGASRLIITGPGVLLIPTGYCSLLPNLELFVVQNTPADRLTDAFKEDECKSLKTLKLSTNKLSGLPNAAFRALKGLEGLDLSGNQLVDLAPDTFTGLER